MLGFVRRLNSGNWAMVLLNFVRSTEILLNPPKDLMTVLRKPLQDALSGKTVIPQVDASGTVKVSPDSLESLVLVPPI